MADIQSQTSQTCHMSIDILQHLTAVTLIASQPWLCTPPQHTLQVWSVNEGRNLDNKINMQAAIIFGL